MDYAAYERDGLILADRIGGILDDPRSLTRDNSRGLIVKLRRGAYVQRAIWDQASARNRHILRVRAAVAAAQRPVLISGISAAALWGIPISGGWPSEVTILDEWRGGGRSEPGIRRTAAGFRTARSVEIDGIRVTDLTRTALDVARLHPFAEAIGSLDFALWRKNDRAVTKEMLFDDLDCLDSKSGLRRMRELVTFATHLSDSFGESRNRAVIHLLGFEIPELQVEFRDSEGLIISDYFWRSVNKAGEFDGKQKYTRDQFTRGNPGEVVWREKKREDRLRRMTAGVCRFLTEHASNPQQLERLLIEAGIPRVGSRLNSRGWS